MEKGLAIDEWMADWNRMCSFGTFQTGELVEKRFQRKFIWMSEEVCRRKGVCLEKDQSNILSREIHRE